MLRRNGRAGAGPGWAALVVLLALLAWGLAGAARAADPAGAAGPAYPALTGRVVDGANVLTPDARDALTRKLDDLEGKSSIQLVVATVPSLGGQEIEPYANGLFRFWKLGQAKRNNGALLLVAPSERRVRIEVGYGLEGTLTDALSKVIITNAMVPRFKAGDYAGGIARGTDDIIAVLSSDTSDWQKRPEFRNQADDGGGLDLVTVAVLLFVMVVVFGSLGRQIGRRGGRGPGGGIVFLPTGGGSGWDGGFGGGGSFGGGDGGGFSGGGGSSGGGGASGGW